MGTTAEKLAKLIQTKSEIKQAIIDKGVSVSDNTPFSVYADKIADIPTGEFQDFMYQYDNKTLTYFSTRASTIATTFNFSNNLFLSYISTPNVSAFLPSSCFLNCKALNSIYAPQLTTVSDYCFAGCSSLRELSLPMLSKVGNYWIQNCSLTNVSLPVMSKIINNMFSCQYGMTDCYMPNAYFRITSNGISDTYSNANQFQSCYVLSNLTLNWSKCEVIPAAAFNQCSALSSIDLRYVSLISNNAFYNCRGLTSVSLNGLTRFDPYTFTGCSNLVAIGDLSNCSIIEAYNNGFEYCNNLSCVISGPNVYKAWNYSSGSYNWTIISSIASKLTYNLPNLMITGMFAYPNNVESSIYYLSNAGNSHYVCHGTSVGTGTEIINLSDVVVIDTKYSQASFKGFQSVSEVNDTTSTIQTISPVASSQYSNPINNCFINTATINLPALRYIGHGNFYNMRSLQSFTAPNLMYVGMNAFAATEEQPVKISRNDMYQVQFDTNKYFTVGKSNLTQTTTLDFSDVYIVQGKYSSSGFTVSTTITSLTNTDNIMYIGPYTFYGNTKISQYSFPNLLAADVMAFRGMTGCTSFYAPKYPSPSLYCFNNSISSPIMENELEYGMFFGCTNMSSLVLNWSAITELPEACFSNCTKWVADLTMPNLKKVGNYTFFGCSSLSKLIMPELEVAGYYAFAYLSMVNEINMPKLTDKYEADVFYFGNYAKYLSSVNLPMYSGPVHAGYGGMLSSAPIVYLNIPYANTAASLTNRSTLSIIGPQGKSKLQYLNIEHWSEVTYSHSLYGCSKLTTLIMTDVKSVRGTALANLYSLPSVSVPNLKYIDTNGFGNCSALQSMDLPACVWMGNQVFQGCSALSRVSAPLVSAIGGSLFSGCISLQDVYMPNVGSFTSTQGIESIFYSCSALRSVNIHNIPYITNSFFCSKPNLTTIDCTNASFIGVSAFNECSALTSASFPECLFIGEGAFRKTSALSTVYFPKVSYINNGAFISCGIQNIYSSTFPALTTVRSYNTFLDCKSLQTVEMPLLTDTAGNMFSGCTSLTTVSLPACSYLSNNVFRGCVNLSSVTIPNVSFINDNAFSGCSALSELHVEQVKRFGVMVFYGCQNLQNVYVNLSSVPSLFTSLPMLFDGTIPTSTIFWIKSSMWSAYRSNSSWYSANWSSHLRSY